MDGTGHAQRIEILSRDDAERERQDSPIKEHVMAEQCRVRPVNLVEIRLDLGLGTAEPLRLTIVNLYADTDDLKARVTDVFLRCHARQGEVLGVVRLEIERHETHNTTSFNFVYPLPINLDVASGYQSFYGPAPDTF